MKRESVIRGCVAAWFMLCMVGGGPTTAQTRVRPPMQGRIVITVSFSKAWEYRLDDPVKLIDIGPVTDTKKSNLVALQGGKDSSDTMRKLLVMHWDGAHFAKDASMNFHGLAIDSLLIGKFRSSRSAPVQRTPFDRSGINSGTSGRVPLGGIPPSTGYGTSRPVTPNGKPGLSLPPTQVVTTDGVYAWMSNAMTRLFGAPLDIRLALVLSDQDQDDRLVTGSGDTASSYEIGENYVRESSDGAPTSGPGYVRFGSGTQEFSGAAKMNLSQDVRYVQSSWEGKAKWMVGIAKGSLLKTPDNPTATTGDRLVVFVPKFASRGKSFWQMKMEDFEEDWRSEPLPGRVLDIRVGDPKNDGKTGILVLTSENKDQEGHLYFYQQDR